MNTIPILSGRFVWHDLVTRDVDRARAFYTMLLGWDVRDVPLGDGTYPTIYVDGVPVGGFVHADEAGVPSQWLAYILSADLEHSVERITTGGGVLQDGIHLIASARRASGSDLLTGSSNEGTSQQAQEGSGHVGRFALCRDPYGANFGMLQLGGPHPLPDDLAEGCFTWDELLTNDPAGAAVFYGDALRWKVSTEDLPGIGAYRFCSAGEGPMAAPMAGILGLDEDEPAPSAWLPYLLVHDLDRAHPRAEEFGAETQVEPTDIPGLGRFAFFQDPVGAEFVLFEAAPTD